LTAPSPASLQYQAPQSLDDAIGLLARAGDNGRLLAGGTDLLAQMKTGAVAPALIVDLKRIPELGAIEGDAASGFGIGAAVCTAALGEHAALAAAWPGVVEAAQLIGSEQIQSRASLGGNLCNASPAADSVPALIAAAATCTIAGPDGRRELPVEDFITGPGQTALAPGELVVDIQLPPKPARSGDAYLRLIPRSEMDIAIVGAGVCLSLDESGTCTAARVSLGAVAATPLLVDAAGEALVGSALDDDALAACAAAASAAASPIDDKRGTVAYRTRVAGVLAKRAAVIARDRAGS
jgi:carbon-monoxide dehydrogenase medium subunit